MNQILFPTDFSANSRNALQYAVALAEKIKKSITLLHVYELKVPESRLSKQNLQEEVRNMEALLLPEFGHFVKGIAGDIGFEQILKRGSLRANLTKLSNSERFAWVVMGAKKSGGLKELLFGNFMEALLSNSKTSALLIPSTTPFREIKRIAYASNFIEDNILALQELDEFALLFGAEIVIIHIDDNITKRDRVIGERYEKAVKKFFTSKVKLVVKEDQKVSETIKKYVEEEEVDLLAMLRKERSFVDKMFHSGFTDQMIKQSTIPVLILQEESTLGN